MSNENGAYRWWENYLVRYLMPSIAGAAIVNWLVASAHPDIRQLLLLEVGSQGVQAPTLALLFLYGNLFCYVSSYPILGFHVTRVIDFEHGVWRHSLWDGYVSTLLLACVALFLSTLTDGNSCADKFLPFAAVLAFDGLQLYRIKLALSPVHMDGVDGPVSRLFAYAHTLSRRRGVVEELRVTKQLSKDQEDRDTRDRFDEETEWQKRSIWRREFVDTYRHMREHGNSAFIFVLELTLAATSYVVLKTHNTDAAPVQLSLLAILLGLWAMPAIFIHFVGQHIERRFSWYDRRAVPHEPDSQS